MIVSLVAILSSYGQSVVKDIRSNLARTGTNATGKTSSSIQYRVIEDGIRTTLLVYGRGYVFSVETGRGPRKSNSNQNLRQNILEWMAVRGIGSGLEEVQRERLANFLTYKINKEGTRLFKKGGRKDIISNVVDKPLFDKIGEEVMRQLSDAYMNSIRVKVG